MKEYGANTMAQEAPRAGDLVQALVWTTSENRGCLETGECCVTPKTTEEIMSESEKELSDYLEQCGDKLDAFKVDELAMLARGASEQWGYEQGMRYGARLVFQLLTGRDVSELDGVLDAAAAKAKTLQRAQAVTA